MLNISDLLGGLFSQLLNVWYIIPIIFIAIYLKKYKLKNNNDGKGAVYEKLVSDIYRNKKYTIAEHGKDNGVKDFGIDVIAKKDNEILFIQCKNWNKKNKYRINVKEIQYTRMNVRDYLEKNTMFKHYNWKIIYATSEDILDRGAKYKISENKDEIEHKIIPI